MLKQNNTSTGYMGRVLTLPLLIVLLAMFTLKSKKVIAEFKENMQTTVIENMTEPAPDTIPVKKPATAIFTKSKDSANNNITRVYNFEYEERIDASDVQPEIVEGKPADTKKLPLGTAHTIIINGKKYEGDKLVGKKISGDKALVYPASSSYARQEAITPGNDLWVISNGKITEGEPVALKIVADEIIFYDEAGKLKKTEVQPTEFEKVNIPGLIIVDGKKYSANDMRSPAFEELLNGGSFEAKTLSQAEAKEKYGASGNNGVIELTSHDPAILFSGSPRQIIESKKIDIENPFSLDYNRWRIASASVYFSGTNFPTPQIAKIEAGNMAALKPLMQNLVHGSFITIENVKAVDKDGNYLAVEGKSFAIF